MARVMAYRNESGLNLQGMNEQGDEKYLSRKCLPRQSPGRTNRPAKVKLPPVYEPTRVV